MDRSAKGGMALLGFGVAAAVVAVLTMAVRPSGHVVSIEHNGAYPMLVNTDGPATSAGTMTIRSSRGGELMLADGPEATLRAMGSDRAVVMVEPDARRSERMLAVPTSMQWRHPLPCLPSASVVRAAERDPLGRVGPERIFTRVHTDHGMLPVISIVLPEKALFDPDSGIYVVGNAALNAPDDIMRQYVVDGRWWKYPGNFHFRGKAWERSGHMQLLDADGMEVIQTPVRVRINGQMTRGFAQHALRLLFDDPWPVPLFADGDGAGSHALILRAGGNDQVKAMMRDAFTQGLCVGLPFEVSRATTCVVYINGAYWGVHHIRQRLNEKELARRYGIDSKRIAIVEMRMKNQQGPKVHTDHFAGLVADVKAWDGISPGTLEELDKQMDVDGFLTYMAAMLVLGNKDWPGDNVKYWRYTGPKGDGKPRDGRWYFISGDMDLGFGAAQAPTAELFAPLQRSRSTISNLFRYLMRSPAVQDRFKSKVRELVAGPLSAENTLAALIAMETRMAPEMERHTARWRKPVNADAWQRNVAVMRHYAGKRASVVLEQLDDLRMP